MATITRVEAHRRRGVRGQSEHVDSYVRKVRDAIDSMGGPAVAAKAGIRVSVLEGEALKADRGEISRQLFEARFRTALQTPPPPVPNPPSAPVARPQVEDSVALAAGVLERARTVEPDITASLQEVVVHDGGRLDGLEFRLKTQESLTKKLATKARQKGISQAEYADKVGDALRYTAVVDPEHNIATGRRVLADLQARGNTVESIENSWGEGGPYYGINIQMIAPNGLRWELQLHTADSLERKNTAHYWYEIMRNDSLDLSVREDAKQRSAGSWLGLQKPDGWDDFGTELYDTADKSPFVGGQQRDMPESSRMPATGTEMGQSDPTLQAIKFEGRPRPPAAGTPNDPIAVGADLDAAVRYLAEGLSVRLDQPEEVTVLLEKMQGFIDDVKAKGGKAPNFNLCEISVAGTNLFCHDSKGIPRTKMPQLSGTPVPGSPAAARLVPGKQRVDITQDFRDALAARGIKVERKMMPASHLRATQSELDGAKVSGMVSAMEKGLIPPAGIFVTRDNYVIDGHHRWAANIVRDSADNELGDIEMPVDVVDMDIGAALDFANEFAAKMGIRPQSAYGALPRRFEGAEDAPAGTIRIFDGIKYRKDTDGLWSPLPFHEEVHLSAGGCVGCGDCGSTLLKLSRIVARTKGDTMPADNEVRLAEFSTKRREALGKKGKAFKNSNDQYSYPIASVQDLKNAIQAFGRAKDADKPKLKKYIMAKARALGRADLIPDSWKSVAAATAAQGDAVALARIEAVGAYKRRGTRGQREHVEAYIRRVLDAAGFGSAKTRKAAITAAADRISAADLEELSEAQRQNAVMDAALRKSPPRGTPRLEEWARHTMTDPDLPAPRRTSYDITPEEKARARAARAKIPGITQEEKDRARVARLDIDAREARAEVLDREDAERKSGSFVQSATKAAVEVRRAEKVRDEALTMAKSFRRLGDTEGAEAAERLARKQQELIDRLTALGKTAVALHNRVGASADAEDDALVRLATITHVERYKRRGDGGKSENVGAHVRKVLDSFGAGDSGTKKGAFTSESTVTKNGSGKPTPTKTAPGTPEKPSATSPEQEVADYQLDVKNYTTSLEAAFDGEDVTIPEYKTSADKGTVPKGLVAEGGKALKGSLSEEDVAAVNAALENPKVQALLAGTPVAVLAGAVKEFLTNLNAKRKRMLALTYGAMVNRQEGINKTGEFAQIGFDLSDPLPAIVENVAHVITHWHTIMGIIEPLLHQVGMSKEDEMSEDSALVRLASITQVEGYKRKGDRGRSEQVGRHVRVVRDSFGAGDSGTKKGAFAPKGSSGRTRVPAKATGNYAVDLAADADDYTDAMDDALAGNDFDIPTYRTGRKRGTFAIPKGLPKQAVSALKDMTPQEGKEAQKAAKNPKIKELLAKTPLPVLAEALKNMLTNVKKHGHKAVALTFAALVIRHEKIEEGSETANALFEATEPTLGIVHIMEEVLHAAPHIIEALEPIMHAVGLSQDLDADDLRLAQLFAQAELKAQILALGSRASLNRSPRKNWVENAGHLPPYVREVARSIERESGVPLSRAIAMAISRIKRWIVTGSPEVKAKAIAAIAAWEKLKAKNRLRKAASAAS